MITDPAVPPVLPATTASVPPLMPTKPLPLEVAPTSRPGRAVEAFQRRRAGELIEGAGAGAADVSAVALSSR